jgi:hypothetical protein
MQIGVRAKCAQLQERDPFEAKTNNWIFFCVAGAFVPQTAIRLQQLRIFLREAIKTRTTESILAFDDEAKRHRQFAERLLISLDGCQSCNKIALTVCSATRVKLSVLNGGCERPRRPFS